MSLPEKNPFSAAFPIAGPGGMAAQSFAQYMAKLDALVVALSQGNLPPLVNAANDAAAKAAGVKIGQMYLSGSTVHVRIV